MKAGQTQTRASLKDEYNVCISTCDGALSLLGHIHGWLSLGREGAGMFSTLPIDCSGDSSIL